MPKKRGYNILSVISKMSRPLCLGMLMVFAGLQVIQSLHSHKQIVSISKNGGEASVQKTGFSCPICDYVLHKQDSPGNCISELALTHFNTAPVMLQNVPYQFLRAVFVLSFTNKGPPAPSFA